MVVFQYSSKALHHTSRSILLLACRLFCPSHSAQNHHRMFPVLVSIKEI